MRAGRFRDDLYYRLCSDRIDDAVARASAIARLAAGAVGPGPLPGRAAGGGGAGRRAGAGGRGLDRPPPGPRLPLAGQRPRAGAVREQRPDPPRVPPGGAGRRPAIRERALAEEILSARLSPPTRSSAATARWSTPRPAATRKPPAGWGSTGGRSRPGGCGAAGAAAEGPEVRGGEPIEVRRPSWQGSLTTSYRHVRGSRPEELSARRRRWPPKPSAIPSPAGRAERCPADQPSGDGWSEVR